jgi:asparagine synthetase B (glutamine-hydrolysing)
MSGGFDSTALAAVAKTLTDAGRAPPVHACSAVFPGLACDEEARIRLVASALTLPSRLVKPLARAVTLAEINEDVLRHDAPVLNAQRPIFDAKWTALRELGASVVLTGIGGDELAIDWQYEVDLVRPAPASDWPSMVRRVANIEQSGLLRATRMVLGAITDHRMAKRRRSRWLVRARMRQLAMVASDSGVRLGFDAHSKEVRYGILTDPKSESAYGWWQREGAAAGFTIRSPFQDRRLIELVQGTPAALQPRTFDRAQYKPTLVQAIGPLLPPELTRTYWKVDFGSFVRLVERASVGPLTAALGDTRRWLAREFVSRASLVAARTLVVRPRLAHDLTRVIALEVWLRSIQ